jgi:hypothetical protein
MASERIKAFIDWFIRSEFVTVEQSERDADFINYPERAGRCYDAAEHGCDGKTHAEVIDDWREIFADWLRERKRGRFGYTCFDEAVSGYFDELEAWHLKSGSLYQEIG